MQVVLIYSIIGVLHCSIFVGLSSVMVVLSLNAMSPCEFVLIVKAAVQECQLNFE